MKRFINTDFILFIKGESNNPDCHVSESQYDDFQEFVLSEKDNFKSLDDYRNALIFTKSKLSAMKAETGGKK